MSKEIEWIYDHKSWKGLEEIGCIRKTIIPLKGEKIAEMRYYILSVTDVKLFARSVWEHWGVESFHWQMDVTFRDNLNTTQEKNSILGCFLSIDKPLYKMVKYIRHVYSKPAIEKYKINRMGIMLRRKLGLLISIMLLLFLGGSIAVKTFGNQREAIKREGQITVVTSFYPMYLLTKNLMDGIKEAEVINLTENHEGCLHDYHLLAKDMKLLSRADIFIINGGGIEEFAENIMGEYSHIKVITAAKGMKFLEGDTHHHSEEEEEEHEQNVHEQNAHVWMSVARYMEEVEMVTKELIAFDSLHQASYKKNSERYLKELEGLWQEVLLLKEEMAGCEIVIFHDAFAYLAESLGITVIHSLNLDEESALNPGELAQVIDEINLHQVEYLWVQEGAAKAAADVVAAETGAKILILDTLINGETNPDYYIRTMSSNIKLLRENIEKQ